MNTESLSYHCPLNIGVREKIIFTPKDKLLKINHYRFQSYEYLLGIKSQRGGGVDKSKYRDVAACDLISRYLESPLEENNSLTLRSADIIDEVNKIKQLRPLVEIYNSQSWSKVYDNLKNNNDMVSETDLIHMVSNLLN